MVENRDIFEGLTKEQERVILALLNNRTVREAAVEAKVGETTVYRYLQKDKFKEAYNSARLEVFGQALAALQNGISEAVQTLKDIHTDKEQPPATRVTAAKTIIETSIKIREQEDVLDRIEKIEQLLQKNKI